MTKRMRAIMAVLMIVAVAVFAGIGPSAQAGPTPSTSSSTSGGCLPPTLGADLWAQGFPFSEGEIQDRDRDCDILCRSHVRKCRRIVRMSRTCNSGTTGAIAGLISDVCNTIPNRNDRRSCRRGADDFRSDVRSCIIDDALTARGCCDYNYQACVGSCTESKGPPIQKCFTGGACLFDLFNSTFEE